MQSRSSPHRRSRAGLLMLALALTPLAGCVSRGYPTHGGGKRFFQEQALVAGAIDAALAQIDFRGIGQLTDGATDIGVHLFSVAHSGGGVQNGSGGILARLFGSLPVVGAAAHESPSVAVTGPALAPSAPGQDYSSFAFESADDIRYLMGRMIGVLGDARLRVHAPDAVGDKPLLCVLVRQLGIDQSDFDALVYTEKSLRARADLEVFLVHQGDIEGSTDKAPQVTRIGSGTATMRFREDFFLGFGPLRDSEPQLESPSGLASQEVQR